MIKRILLFAVSCFVSLAAFAQLTITGTISNEQDQPLGGASVVADHTLLGAITNDDGTFRLKNLPPGQYTLFVTFMGYQKVEYQLDLKAPATIRIKMKPADILADEVIIHGSRAGLKDPVSFTNFE
jgi:iron complex outermembrane receptor protein